MPPDPGGRGHRVGSASGLTSSSPPAFRLASGAYIFLVLVITLVPLNGDGGFDPCRWCSRRAIADMVVNLLLLAPLGTSWTLAGIGAGRVLLQAALLSGSIEVMQLVIPGRWTSAMDFALNVGGAGLAAGAVRLLRSAR